MNYCISYIGTEKQERHLLGQKTNTANFVATQRLIGRMILVSVLIIVKIISNRQKISQSLNTHHLSLVVVYWIVHIAVVLFVICLRFLLVVVLWDTCHVFVCLLFMAYRRYNISTNTYLY